MYSWYKTQLYITKSHAPFATGSGAFPTSINPALTCTTCCSFLMLTLLFCRRCIYFSLHCLQSPRRGSINVVTQTWGRKQKAYFLMCQHGVTHCKVTALALAPACGRERSLGAGFGTWHKLALSCATRGKVQRCKSGLKTQAAGVRCSP